MAKDKCNIQDFVSVKMTSNEDEKEKSDEERNPTLSSEDS